MTSFDLLSIPRVSSLGEKVKHSTQLSSSFSKEALVLRNLFRERYPWNLFREKMISRIPFFHGYFLLSKKVSVKPFFERGRTLKASQSIIAYSRAVLSLLPRGISFLVGSAAASCRFFFQRILPERSLIASLLARMRSDDHSSQAADRFCNHCK